MAKHSDPAALQGALALHQQGRIAEAAILYREMIAREPRDAPALHLLGVAELQLGKPALAADLISRAVELQPQNAQYLSNLGLALSQSGRPRDALAALDRSLAITPNSANTLSHRAAVLRALARYDEALASCARALALDPAHADALNNRGAILHSVNRAGDALASFDRALTISPRNIAALANRAAVLNSLGRFEEARRDLNLAGSLSPDNAEILNSRGNALAGLRLYTEALADFDRAIALVPENVPPRFNRATVLAEMRRGTDAITAYGEVVRMQPDHVPALVNRGLLLSDAGRLAEALADYDRAVALAPDYPLLPGWRLFCKLRLCGWQGIEAERAAIEAAVSARKAVCSPSVLLAISGAPELLRICAEEYVRRHWPDAATLLPQPPNDGRIRLGYFSADFHNHATAWLTAAMFERHDRARFEVFGFSFGPRTGDEMQNRIARGFDHFVDIGNMTDAQAVKRVREAGIGIALEMKGFTEGSRTGIFAARVAPVQAAYLGYPGTMGAAFMDYLISDTYVTPGAAQAHYAEKLVTLPCCYQPNDFLRDPGPAVVTRRECGLPENAFVFCCFNNSYKITPEIFRIWMRLLQRIDESVLWLLEDNRDAAANLRLEARARGIDPQRLIFAGRVNHERHLARHRLADLFLDTVPYNAHTTASDALRMGVPLLTCNGPAFQSRVAGSLLTGLGLPELIAPTLAGYEAIACRFALDPAMRRRLKQRLAENLPLSPLFDPVRYTRTLETALTALWNRHRQGLPPAPLTISAA